jgi:DNA replication protein DnaC
MLGGTDKRSSSVPNIGDSTVADAILDRLGHNARKIYLKGESMASE